MMARRQKDESEMDKLKSKYQASPALTPQPFLPKTPGMSQDQFQQAPQSLLQFESSAHGNILAAHAPDYEVEDVDDMVRR